MSGTAELHCCIPKNQSDLPGPKWAELISANQSAVWQACHCGLTNAQVVCMVRLAGVGYSLFHPAAYRAHLWYKLHWVVRQGTE